MVTVRNGVTRDYGNRVKTEDVTEAEEGRWDWADATVKQHDLEIIRLAHGGEVTCYALEGPEMTLRASTYSRT